MHLRAMGRSFAPPPFTLFEMLENRGPLFGAAGINPFAPALGVALLHEIFGRVQKGLGDIARCSRVKLVPRAVERNIVVRQLAQAVEARIGRLAALPLVGPAASLGEGVGGKRTAVLRLVTWQVIAQ